MLINSFSMLEYTKWTDKINLHLLPVSSTLGFLCGLLINIFHNTNIK